MSRFTNLLQETLSIINEQDPTMDPSAMPADHEMLPPAPPSGAVSQADKEDIEMPEETDLRQEEIYLVDLARRLFLYGLNSERSEINDEDFAKIAQKVTDSNADELKAVMERLIRDNQIETGL